ncbi:segregation/condensation protein A [Candidatus Uhrbacteria bacterium]|jgi:segregation and condensation protein A|nr:segregation/condensation protein A [Candidatus Uhrbacteria bacterium]
MEFSVKQDAFSGPLGLLLELLDKRELEITDVALADIADEYLLRLESADVLPEELADFLLIASRLIYLKSRELMPYLRMDEEEEEIGELEEQLRLYRLFVNAAEKINEQFSNTERSFERPFTRIKIDQKPAFAPAENLTSDNLRTAFAGLLKRLQPFFTLQQVSMERVKSVEERISELTTVLQSRASMKFQDVVSGAKRKMDVVVSFLALLELARRQHVSVRQSGQDVLIERM